MDKDDARRSCIGDQIERGYERSETTMSLRVGAFLIIHILNANSVLLEQFMLQVISRAVTGDIGLAVEG